MTTPDLAKFGLKQYLVTEPESQWSKVITAKGRTQARNKAWKQYWDGLPYKHCQKKDLKVKEYEN